MSWISRLPFCSVASSCGVDDLSSALDPASFEFGLFTAQPAKMRGSLRTRVGVKDFTESSTTPSQSSLQRTVTRPPRLKSRAWHMEKLALQLSQYLGRSGGSRKYLRKRASRHSYAPSSVLKFKVWKSFMTMSFLFHRNQDFLKKLFILYINRSQSWGEVPHSE